MIREANTASLAFEQVVIEEMAAPLAAYSFRFQSPFHLYRNQIVLFTREREGHQERLEVGRHVYDEEAMQAGIISRIGFDVRAHEDDEVDRAPNYPDGSRRWASRHQLYVSFVTELGTSDLLTNGQAGTSDTGEDWFYFADEADLRRRLQEILPLILNAGLQSFDDSLEDMLTGRAAPTTA